MRGYASYIADQYAGHYTTSGAIYQPQGWTAAHNTLPFGTVNVTVNDRFPYYPNRVINLSRTAAEYIQLPYHQLGDVTVTAKTLVSGPAPQAAYAAPPPARHSTPQHASYAAPPQTHYNTPPAYKKPVAKTYHAPPAATYRKPTSIPPAGAGINSMPAGLPPPPPGYR